MPNQGGPQFKVEGLATLTRTLGDASRAIADMRHANVKVMGLLTARGRTDSPRRSGSLAMAVRGGTDRKGARNYAVVEDPKPYAKRVHWGYQAYGQQGQPWLLKAARAQRRQILREYREQTAKTTKRVRGA